MEEKYIYLFFDYEGTIDKLCLDENAQIEFFKALQNLEERFEAKVIVCLLSEAESQITYKNLTKIKNVFSSYSKGDAVICAVSEYCGFLIQGGNLYKLIENNKLLLDKKREIEMLAREFNGALNGEVKSYFNITFSDIGKDDLERFETRVREIIVEFKDEIRITSLFNENNKECNILPLTNSKATAVKYLYNKLSSVYKPYLILLAGDSLSEDYVMLEDNKDFFENENITAFFLAPGVDGLCNDKHIIKEKESNIFGIVKAIERVVTL